MTYIAQKKVSFDSDYSDSSDEDEEEFAIPCMGFPREEPDEDARSCTSGKDEEFAYKGDDFFMQLKVEHSHKVKKQQKRRADYRFPILAFSSLLIMGPNFSFHMPSALQDQLQSNVTANSTCPDCLGLSGSEYNLLFAVCLWADAIAVIPGGYLMDKCGNRVGALLFSGVTVIGSCIVALGITIKHPYYLYVMLFGRFLFGAAYGPLSIVQSRMTAFWFFRKELAMAYGIVMAISRLGIVLNFLVTNAIYESVGLIWTFWIAVAFCVFGFLLALIVSYIDARGVRELGLTEQIIMDSKKVHPRDILQFSISFWLLALIITLVYSAVFAFLANATKFIKDKYEYSDKSSAYIAGAMFDVVMVLCPLLGIGIDKFGNRGMLLVVCSVLTVPVFVILAFTNLHPLICTIWLGVAFSYFAASAWPFIAVVTSQAILGTAIGVASSCYYMGVGVSEIIVGELLGNNQASPADEDLRRWKHVMMFLLSIILALVGTSVALNMIDIKKGGVLNRTKSESLRQQLEQISETEPLLRKASADSI